jgi:hypothetical protein
MLHVLHVLFLSVFILQVVMHESKLYDFCPFFFLYVKSIEY